jgi:hypothetical protein
MPSLAPFGPAVSEEKIFLTLAIQAQWAEPLVLLSLGRYGYLELPKSPNFTEITLDITEITIKSSEIPSRRKARYNFVHLKAMHKISPLEELVGGRSPPEQFPEVNMYACGPYIRQ